MRKLILTVCKGNIYRSVIAEVVIGKQITARGLQDLYCVESRGIQGTHGIKPPQYKNIRSYPRHWELTQQSLSPFEIIIPEEKEATPVDDDIVERASIVLALDASVYGTDASGLVGMFPWAKQKIRLLSELAGEIRDIRDPHDDLRLHVFSEVARDIHDTISNHFDVLLALASR